VLTGQHPRPSPLLPYTTLFRSVEYPMGHAIRRLVDIQYERNEVNLVRGKFRVKGDTLEVFPSYGETIVRVEFWGDEVERILRMRSEEHTSELQSRENLVCRLLL